MNYHHLTIEERSCIRKYYAEGLSYRKIAQLIGRSPSTVSREINRNRTHMYDILSGLRSRSPVLRLLCQFPAGEQSIDGSMTDICLTEIQKCCGARGNPTV